ncbi:MAG: hypothetical protein ACPG4X_16945 [Pikeienuella sp.]
MGNPDMTLRDWFAGQALAALINSIEDWPDHLTQLQAEAETAYMFADAMLAARTEIERLNRDNTILRANKSGSVYVCPECDIAGCKHVRAALEGGE